MRDLSEGLLTRQRVIKLAQLCTQGLLTPGRPLEMARGRLLALVTRHGFEAMVVWMGDKPFAPDKNRGKHPGFRRGARTISIATSAGLTEVRSYDGRGRLIGVALNSTDGETRTTTYIYDAAGRRTGTNYTDTTPDVNSSFSTSTSVVTLKWGRSYPRNSSK